MQLPPPQIDIHVTSRSSEIHLNRPFNFESWTPDFFFRFHPGILRRSGYLRFKSVEYEYCNGYIKPRILFQFSELKIRAQPNTFFPHDFFSLLHLYAHWA